MYNKAQLAEQGIKPVSRRVLSRTMRVQTHFVWVGECGYDERPYRAKPGTSGRLATDRDYAPVRVIEDWANRLFRATETPPGDCLRWLDECPRGTMVYYPNFSGCHHRGDTHLFKAGDGRWYELGYWDWELNQYAA